MYFSSLSCLDRMKKKYYVKKKLKAGFHNIEGGHLLFLAITSISINILPQIDWCKHAKGAKKGKSLSHKQVQD